MAQPRRRQEQDPVIGLISGRMVPVKNAKGETSLVFQAFKLNPNPTLKELRKQKGDRFSEDQILSFERLRLAPLNLDKTCFKKSAGEITKLKEAKKENRLLVRKAGFNPNLRLNVSAPQVLRRS